ncbi:hypothetical protein [Rubritalea tangerina]|uniref:hypothetical protein n=1 Tax=Rubritalea tangerina TaxID=430798 RepID=UPI0036716948
MKDQCLYPYQSDLVDGVNFEFVQKGSTTDVVETVHLLERMRNRERTVVRTGMLEVSFFLAERKAHAITDNQRASSLGLWLKLS